ncbi:MAG: group II intron reverse transcriptase/maturase [Crocosphaera sp.]
MNTEKPMYEWNTLPWRKLEKIVFKLQSRIYRASQRGDVKTVHRLQKLLMSSWAAKCIAVRKVTQDNQGRSTAGIDGQKSLSPKDRMKLVKNLKITGKAQPTRRVWIPKPGTEEKRPLGIPTIDDRALQTLVKMALEPEWEAKFEPNSYGFRPGRSAHDAVEAIYGHLRMKPKYVLDADISKCFDKINHQRLLEKLNTTPTLTRQIKAWLKTGVVDNNTFLETDTGTPQGGPLSPLLANIALHGMEECVKSLAERTKPVRPSDGKREKRSRMGFIRYADDFVIIHEDLNTINEAKTAIERWLNNMGLELKPSKTRICHTMEPLKEEKPGFNFLGFHFKHHKAGINHSAKNTNGKVLGTKFIISPSESKIREQYRKLKEIVDKHSSSPQYVLINHLNRITRGWSKYYSTVCSQDIFRKLDHLLFLKLWRWANKRHSNKGKKWIKNKYWHPIRNSEWGFRTIGKIQVHLYKHTDTKIQRHTKVKGNVSPYDGDWTYWGKRMGKHPLTSPTRTKLLKIQKGQCPICGLNFKLGDIMEIDHIIPRKLGGKDSINNFQLLHRHCHDTKTTSDGSLRRRSETTGMYDKH